MSPFVLRRTKQEVAPELPAKWVIDEYCELTDRQRALYRDLLQEGRGRVEALRDARQAGAARMQVLTLLLRLRQVCGDPALLDAKRYGGLPVEQRSGKLQRLFGLLEEALEGGHKVLVFSQFREQLLRIEELIRERTWECLRLDGGTVNRQALVDRFQAEEGPPIFLISLKAGGYGLNLTAADTVIHVDPWWNPAVEAQATDRAHRIGQVKPVTVYRLLTRDTVEQKVVSMQERKRGLSAVVDEAGEEIEGNWSFDELEGLLGG
jgi:SNF2 family DNA or RNA helicase